MKNTHVLDKLATLNRMEVSDLRFYLSKKDIVDAVKKMNIDQNSVEEWKEAISYILNKDLNTIKTKDDLLIFLDIKE